MFDKRKSNWRKFHPLKGLLFVVLAAAFMLLIGNVVMYLWNAIIPDALGAKPISFWQALGLFILFRILVGGVRYGTMGGRRRSKKRRYWKEKWMSMNEEERDQFRRKWKERCNRRKE